MNLETLPDRSPPRWGIGGVFLVAAVFGIGLCSFPLRVVGANGEYLPGDDIDNPLNNFVLEHGYRYLTGHEKSFWSVPSFYPQPLVTSWSDAHLGMLPLYSACRLSGLTPERAFQGHFLVSFLLNYLAAAWALKRLGFGPFGTASGAYLFAFGLPLVPQLNHTQLFPRFFVPLAVLFGREFLRSPQTWRLAALAGCVVGQIYVSIYIGYFLILLLTSGLLLVAVRFRHSLLSSLLFPSDRRAWQGRLLVGFGAVLALLPLVIGHARGVGSAPREQVRLLAPRASAWLTPPAAALAPSLLDPAANPAAVGEQQLMPGLLPIGAVVAGLVLAIRPSPLASPRAACCIAACSLAVLVLLVTRLELVWLYAPVSHLPGTAGIRAIGRVVLVLLFPAGVAVAFWVDALTAWATRAGRLPGLGMGVLLLGLVVADQWLDSPERERAEVWAQLRYPLPHALSRKEQIADAFRRHPAPTLVYVFPSVAEHKRLGSLVVQLEAMRAAQDLGLPCVNGWSGYVPRDWDYFPTYRALMEWLTVRHHLSDAQLAGLVVVGEPLPDADPQYEAEMRARFPPRSLGCVR